MWRRNLHHLHIVLKHYSTLTSWWDINYLQLRYIVRSTKVKSILVLGSLTHGPTHASRFSSALNRSSLWCTFEAGPVEEDFTLEALKTRGAAASNSTWLHARQHLKCQNVIWLAFLCQRRIKTARTYCMFLQNPGGAASSIMDLTYRTVNWILLNDWRTTIKTFDSKVLWDRFYFAFSCV